MYGSGSPFVKRRRGVVSLAEGEGRNDTDTDVGEIVDGGREV